MYIQIRYIEYKTSFTKYFNREAQVLFTCGRLDLEVAFTSTVLSVNTNLNLELYMKEIFLILNPIFEIKEAVLDIFYFPLFVLGC